MNDVLFKHADDKVIAVTKKLEKWLKVKSAMGGGGAESETADKVKEMGKSRMGGDGRDEI